MDQHHLQPCSDEDWQHCSTPRDFCNLAMIRVYLFCFRRLFPFVPFSTHSKYLLKIFFNRGYNSFCKNASLKARSCKKMFTLSQSPSTSPGYTTLLSHSVRREYVSHTFVSLPLPPPSPFSSAFFFFNCMSLVWVEFVPNICVDAAYSWLLSLSPQIQATWYTFILLKSSIGFFSPQYAFRSQDEHKKSWDIWDNGIG